MPSFIVTAVIFLYALIADNSICGVPDADMLTQRHFAAHAVMISISIHGEGKDRNNKGTGRTA